MIRLAQIVAGLKNLLIATVLFCRFFDNLPKCYLSLNLETCSVHNVYYAPLLEVRFFFLLNKSEQSN